MIINPEIYYEINELINKLGIINNREKARCTIKSSKNCKKSNQK